jgi:hypothetical protein
MRVTGKHVGQAVSEAEKGADDSRHVASVVGAFMQRQPMVGHYVQAHTSELGLEGTVLVLLHASVLARAVEIANGKRIKLVQARDLDAAAGARADELAQSEPELASYVDANLSPSDPTLGGKKRTIALGLLRVVLRAILDAA